MSPKKENLVNITSQIFQNPMRVIETLSENLNMAYTKVIQTFVMENREVELVLEQKDSSSFKGELIWLGKRKDGEEGLVFCFNTKNDLKLVYPTPENTEHIIINRKKERILISSDSKEKCSVCGKTIEILDTFLKCPVCEEKAHKEHLLEYIKSEGKCPVCKKPIKFTNLGIVVTN